jgi:hypothetical protein
MAGSDVLRPLTKSWELWLESNTCQFFPIVCEIVLRVNHNLLLCFRISPIVTRLLDEFTDLLECALGCMLTDSNNIFGMRKTAE